MTEELFQKTDAETGFTVSVTGEEGSRRFSIQVTEPNAWTDAEVEGSLEEAISIADDMLAVAKKAAA